jgi:adenine deaminase
MGEDKRRIIAIAFFLVATTGTAEPIALIAERLIDGRSDVALRSAVVLVENDRIKAVGSTDIIPDGATVIDLGDVTLMPGMIDAPSAMKSNTVRTGQKFSRLAHS